MGTYTLPMTAGDHTPTSGLRHAPPALQEDWIERVRLQQHLAKRFDRSVITMTAPAGYGKTAALARALARNDHDPIGVDLWVQCRSHDNDGPVLADAILRSAGLEPPVGDWRGDGIDLADALLQFAPRQVCLVLDDAHVISPGSTGAVLLQQLLDALPQHAHLLIAGRSDPSLHLARRKVDGTCLEIGLADLEFDADEADLATHGAGASDLARWPAMTKLLRDDRPGASADYLLEEVATSLGPTTRTTLTALSYVRRVDDEAATAAAGERTSAAHLLADLPLVLVSNDGSFQLHDLWHEALVGDRPIDGDVSAAVSRLAEVEFSRGRLLGAAELFAAAGDDEGLNRAAIEIVSQPLIGSAAAQYRALDALTTPLGDDPLAMLVRSTLPMTGDEVVSAELFARTAEVARVAGSEGIEVAALQNELNLRALLDANAIPPLLIDRVLDLAGGAHPNPRLEAVAPFVSMFRAMEQGEEHAENAVRHLAPLRSQRAPFAQAMLAFALSDLGRPEEVSAPPPSDLDEVADTSGQYMGQAMWLRGDLPPELTLEVGEELARRTISSGLVHVRISISSVYALISLAAGDLVTARTFANSALRDMNETRAPSVRAFALVADAATVLLEQGERSAADRMAVAMHELPIGLWPGRPYMYAMPLAYLCSSPESREQIDRCHFGPALTTATDAGRALVALRDHGDTGPASQLPWHLPNLLRAHVLPPHLVELAASAASVGAPGADQMLEQVPDARRHLLQVAEMVQEKSASQWATNRASRLPARPAEDLVVDLLGPARLRRGGATVTDAKWVRRERVRQLLAFLTLHGRVTRRRAAEALWPDLDPNKAGANLRVTLSYVQDVLEPGRQRGDMTWYLQSDPEFLQIDCTRLVVDTDQFDRFSKEARTLDHGGRGTAAIEQYRNAVALVRGDYAADWPDAEWTQLERLRLQAIIVASTTRLGELILVRGEPEEAGSWATRVLRAEPSDERAHRLLARSLHAQGNTRGAVKTLDLLGDQLRADGLSVDRETQRLAESLRSPNHR